MIKYFLLILFIVLSTSLVLSQSKKDQILILLNKVDSLDQVVSNKNFCIAGKDIEISKLQNQISQENKKNLELQNLLELQIQESQICADSLKMALKRYQMLISKGFYTFSQFGKFDSIELDVFEEKEINFLIDYFSSALKQEFGINQTIIVECDSIGKIEPVISVAIKGEAGYTPAYEINLCFKKSLFGDLNLDGQKEIIFQVGRTGGGTAYWNELYVLNFLPENIFKISNVKVECACEPGFYCWEPNTEIIEVVSRRLLIKSLCFSSEDATCCPSQVFNTWYEYFDGNLKLVD
jgi:hypothetical protein